MPKLKVPTVVAPTPAADQPPPIHQQLQSQSARRPKGFSLGSLLEIDARGPASSSPSTSPFKRGPRMKSCVAVKSRKSGTPRGGKTGGLMANFSGLQGRRFAGGSDDEVRSLEASSVLNSFSHKLTAPLLSPSFSLFPLRRWKVCIILPRAVSFPILIPMLLSIILATSAIVIAQLF